MAPGAQSSYVFILHVPTVASACKLPCSVQSSFATAGIYDRKKSITWPQMSLVLSNCNMDFFTVFARLIDFVQKQVLFVL